ncbi:prolipoprotein diacylglyceryl transferase [Desulfobacterota bacterium AH_259_B03_O07]|nr:prolipoprotein diacylglyceryl transferase [Desulfobacterota bacterium AH_259_B03_O07]
MYPELFKIGNFEISSFGFMVAVAFLVAYWIGSLEFRRKGLSEKLLGNLFLAAMIGGIGGAKILYLIENVPLTELLKNPISHLLSRGGLTFYGGLIAAVVLAFIVAYRNKISFWTLGDAAAPALVLAYAVGRIGCFLVGDDYGVPSNLPWAIAFPKGLPPTLERVHPTQIYEIIVMTLVFLIIWNIRKKPAPNGWLFSIYLLLAGFERFFIEFIRSTTGSPIPNISIAQLTAIGLIVVGAAKLISTYSKAPNIEKTTPIGKKRMKKRKS